MTTPPDDGPSRTCVGCGRVAEPAALMRIARRPDGTIAAGRHEPGRGAWLCAGSVACFERAVERRAVARALRTEITHEDVESLRARLFG